MTNSTEGTSGPTERGGEPEDVALCPVCRSLDVHPSRSSYPMDAKRLAGSEGAFWRCQNCGDRFMGPFPPASSSASAPHSRHAHKRHSHHDHRTGRLPGLSLHRWIVPIIALLTGAAILMFLFDDRVPPRKPGIGAPR